VCSGTKPDHVDSSVAPDRYLRASHRANRHGTFGLAVYANGLREVLPVGRAAHVFDIARRGIALEINHVQHAVAVQHSLWLNPFTRRAKQSDLRHLTGSHVPGMD